MIIKSYKKADTEFMITIGDKGLYRVIRMIKDQEPYLGPEMEYECANEVFDYFVDINEERDIK
jgi:hypothetical protein